MWMAHARRRIALKELEKNGYDITFAESARADGGCVMRGNDVLQGTPDIMVCDSLTGNIMVKMLSSYTTGGSFEASGYGYGPGVGEGYEQLVMIVSRASGAPVIAGAIRYAAELVKSKVFEIAKKEFVAADKAGLKDILAARKQMSKPGIGSHRSKGSAKRDRDIPDCGNRSYGSGRCGESTVEAEHLCRERNGLYRTDYPCV